MRAGKDVITNPTQLKNLYENDLYDPTSLIAAIRAHDFGVVVFRAQFYPPPVLDAVYEAYFPADMIPMNGFNYEIWRPGPPQDERQSLATNLETIAAGDSQDQAISLPLDRAAGWLHHALTYHNWTPRDDGTLTAGSDGCYAGQYQQAERMIRVELCPTAEGSVLTLSGDAS